LEWVLVFLLFNIKHPYNPLKGINSIKIPPKPVLSEVEVRED
jgi:hypothetical protein